MTDDLASLAKERLALEQALKELDKKEARLKQKQEAEDWVSAEEARNILAQLSDQNGTLSHPRLLAIVKTLVWLRPEPNNESDVYFTWETPCPVGSNTPDDQFSVSVDRDGDILLNDDYEQVAHLLDFGQAELLGCRLLAASDRVHKLIEEES